MRFILMLLGCCGTLLSLAQTSPKSIKIQISYEKNGKYLEQAVETIEAVNSVGSGTTVDYQAGRAITLSPGFVAANGSTFAAIIQPVSSKNEFSLLLQAHPNPFDQSTIRDFTLPEAGIINLIVVDEKGRIIEQLLENSAQTAGQHQFEWKPQALSSGIYIPVLRTERQQISSRILKK